MIIGSLRDLRVNYYKSLSKKETLTDDQRQQYTVVSQALKVILNASYGVMGAEIFPLYFLPVAEATTAIGRFTILETIKNVKRQVSRYYMATLIHYLSKIQLQNKFKL
jgi:DNA polymerase I